MLLHGIVRKSRSAFSSKLWIIPKKSVFLAKDVYRVVVDYWEPTQRMKAEKFPLPRIEEVNYSYQTRTLIFTGE